MAELLLLLGVITFIITLVIVVFSDDKEKYQVASFTGGAAIFCALMLYFWPVMFDYEYYEIYDQRYEQLSTSKTDIVDGKQTTTTVTQLSCHVVFYKDYYYASNMIDIGIQRTYPGECNQKETHNNRNLLVWDEYFKELNK